MRDARFVILMGASSSLARKGPLLRKHTGPDVQG